METGNEFSKDPLHFLLGSKSLLLIMLISVLTSQDQGVVPSNDLLAAVQFLYLAYQVGAADDINIYRICQNVFASH